MSIATVEDALAYGHAQLSCYLLVGVGIPVALMVDDRPTAKRYLATLIEQSAQHHFLIFEVCARCFEGALRVKTGELASGVPQLRRAIDELTGTGFTMHLVMLLGILSEGLGQSGNVAEGLVIIDQALAESERNEARWYLAELLRVKGELTLRTAADGAASAAEDCFLQALSLAHRQGALSWELRAATSLAGLWHGQKRTREARELLAPIYDRFTDGHARADLVAAKTLLDRLQ